MDKLNPWNHWIDMGGGEGNAVETFLKEVGRIEKSPQVTLLSYRVGRDLSALQRDYKLNIIEGKFVENVPNFEIGKADLITDLYGPYTYSETPDKVLQKYGELLNKNGVAYLMVGLEREYGRSKVETSEGSVLLHEWLQQNTTGLTFETMKSNFQGHRVVFLRVTKTGDLVSVKPLELIGTEYDEQLHGPIPSRIYREGSEAPKPQQKSKPQIASFSSNSIRDLSIRRLQDEDVHELAKLAFNPNIAKNFDIQVSATVLKQLYERHDEGPNWQILNRGVYDPTTGSPVGAFQLGRQRIESIWQYRVQPNEKVGQVLFTIAPSLLERVAPGVLSMGFNERGLDRIVTRITKDSKVANTLLELGFNEIPNVESDSHSYYEIRREKYIR